jgi:hypothetical protein
MNARRGWFGTANKQLLVGSWQFSLKSLLTTFGVLSFEKITNCGRPAL